MAQHSVTVVPSWPGGIARGRRRRLGTAMVEAALSITVALSMLFGIIYFGQAAWAYDLLSHAAREGARYGIVHGRSSKKPATAQDITNVVKAQAIGIDPSKMTVSTSWIPDNRDGSSVKVVVNYTFSLVMPFVPAKNLALTSTSQMVIVY